ncbi:hypothetical protein C8Q77DRAFT_830955 [Trametes polyzona]|nr:hypothetical protein C8Q77DRAFT_830955 [Trametes polyzona]
MDTDVGLTVGALLLGTLITAVGYGITTTQTYMYRSRFPQDPWFIRWTVWTLLALDTTHIVFSWHLVYHYVVLNFGNHAALERVAWSFSATIVITAIITTIVHCFYARRILILGNRRRLVPALILVLSVVRLALGFLACAQIITLKTFQRVQHDTLATVVVGLGSGTLADCVITTTLVYLLRTHKSQFSPGYVDESLTGRSTAVRTPKPDIALASYIGSLNSTLDRIVYWTVNNGVLTSVVGVAFLVTQFSHMPANMVFIALHLLLSKRLTRERRTTTDTVSTRRKSRSAR